MTVVDFVAHKEKLEEQKFDELVDANVRNVSYAEIFSITTLYDVIDALEDDDVFVANYPKAAFDLLFLAEILKSLVLRAQGNSHPLHRVTEEMFKELDPKVVMEEILS